MDEVRVPDANILMTKDLTKADCLTQRMRTESRRVGGRHHSSNFGGEGVRDAGRREGVDDQLLDVSKFSVIAGSCFKARMELVRKRREKSFWVPPGRGNLESRKGLGRGFQPSRPFRGMSARWSTFLFLPTG